MGKPRRVLFSIIYLIIFQREGYSVYNKIYEFNSQVFGEPVRMVMTSVSGHLLSYEFVGKYKNWHSCNPLELFDAPIQKFCPQDSQKLKVIITA